MPFALCRRALEEWRNCDLGDVGSVWWRALEAKEGEGAATRRSRSRRISERNVQWICNWCALIGI
jgi:hypothetical protein